MFLLDTNVVSELRKPERADANVRAWSKSQPAALFHISAVTIFEIERGVLLMERRAARQGAELRAWFEVDVLAQFAERVISVDASVAKRAAALHIPNPRPERDAFIAATALVHGFTIVTRDAQDFRDIGAAVFNPWEAHA